MMRFWLLTVLGIAASLVYSPLPISAEPSGFLRINVFPRGMVDHVAADGRIYPINPRYQELYNLFGNKYDPVQCPVSAWEPKEAESGSHVECLVPKLYAVPSRAFRTPPLTVSLQWGVPPITTVPIELLGTFEGPFNEFSFQFPTKRGKPMKIPRDCWDPTFGEVRFFYGSEIPEGWVALNGQKLSYMRDQSVSALMNFMPSNHMRKNHKEMKRGMLVLPKLSGAMVWMDGQMEEMQPIVRLYADTMEDTDYYLGDVFMSLSPRIDVYNGSCSEVQLARIDSTSPTLLDLNERQNLALYSIITERFGEPVWEQAKLPHFKPLIDRDDSYISLYLVTSGTNALYPMPY